MSEVAERYLVFGATGWIGGKLIKLLQEQGKAVVGASSRIEDLQQVGTELDEVKPTHVLLAAGVTGRPNVDWCETNKETTLRVNVVGTLIVADLCSARGIHCTIFGTGCIYSYDEAHPIGGPGFTEEDPPNFTGSFYSKTKGMVQELLLSYSNVLVLRIRMPISDDLSERNFVTKIASYARVIDIPNSVSVLRELLPISLGMAAKRVQGVYNFTNPGTVSHNEVLAMYREHVDPNFEWVNFTVEEQRKVIVADRSNNLLDTTKLEAMAQELGLPLTSGKDSVRVSMKLIRAHLEETGTYPMALPKKR